MSQQSNLQHSQPHQQSDYTRLTTKTPTFVSFHDDSVKNQVVRRPLTQKHKTYLGNESSIRKFNQHNKKNRYKLNNMNERKMFLMLALCEKFIVEYEQRREISLIEQKKLHSERKKIFMLSDKYDFKTIQPVSPQQRNQQQTYCFLLKLRDNIKSYFRQNIINQIRKKRNKLSQVMVRKNNEQINLEAIEESSQKENNNCNNSNHHQQKSQKKVDGGGGFITAEFSSNNNNDNNNNNHNHNMMNDSSLSQSANFHSTGLIMNISSFSNNNSNNKHPQHTILTSHQNKTQNKNTSPSPHSKFHQMKLNQTKSRLRIHPAKNKYQSRKKQQIRLFLQLNQKTEHLQNFRSDEGKFFKFNQNLKITVKNISLCRVVLLGKKEAIEEQFGRLGDDSFYREVNERLGAGGKTYRTERTEGNQKQAQYPLITPSQQQHPFSQSSCQQSLLSYKQKAIRIKHYFQQTTRHFTKIQQFILRFLQSDKNYQSYTRQSSLKNRIHQLQKLTQQQKFYKQFVDKCFHISQISRLYFNVLNQFAHQNVSLREMKMLDKEELERLNKVLILLRYVIIYLQKECENISQRSFFNNYSGGGQFISCLSNMNQTASYNNSTKINYQQFTSSNTKENTRNLPLASTKFAHTTNSQPFKQLQNTLQAAKPQTSQHPSRNPSQIISVPKLMLVPNLQKSEFSTQKIKRGSTHNHKRVSSNSVKSQQIDINQIWKSFYEKKFSSNAMRLRLY